jgi:predicted metal-dependent HD superfamily phosphohydrolase
MITPRELSIRWRALWQTVADRDGDALYQGLSVRYAEPHRAYHTLEHIGECLLQLDMARHLLVHPVEAELAIWFHDAVYNPRRSDNEEQSALLAEEQLQTAGVDRAVAGRTAALIRLTTHERGNLIGDEAFLCDVDLAILGAEPERFDRYDAAIRQEYNWVPEAVYRVERGRVLARFLGRSHIYHSAFFRDRLERQARENLAKAIRRYGVQ